MISLQSSFRRKTSIYLSLNLAALSVYMCSTASLLPVTMSMAIVYERISCRAPFILNHFQWILMIRQMGKLNKIQHAITSEQLLRGNFCFSLKSWQANIIARWKDCSSIDCITKIASVMIDMRIDIRTNGKRQCCLALGLMHPF